MGQHYVVATDTDKLGSEQNDDSTFIKPNTGEGRSSDSLAVATAKIVYIHESTNPGNDPAKCLYEYLAQNDDDWRPDPVAVDNVCAASCKCIMYLQSKGSWVIEVARPLLQLAIAELPLECWSVYVGPGSSSYLFLFYLSKSMQY